MLVTGPATHASTRGCAADEAGPYSDLVRFGVSPDKTWHKQRIELRPPGLIWTAKSPKAPSATRNMPGNAHLELRVGRRVQVASSAAELAPVGIRVGCCRGVLGRLGPRGVLFDAVQNWLAGRCRRVGDVVKCPTKHTVDLDDGLGRTQDDTLGYLRRGELERGPASGVRRQVGCCNWVAGGCGGQQGCVGPEPIPDCRQMVPQHVKADRQTSKHINTDDESCTRIAPLG